MADSKISGLADGAPAVGTDQFPIARAGATLRVTLLNLITLLGSSFAALTHATRHQDGGADEISVTGLSGLLADAQKVTVRKNTGADVGTQTRLNLIEGANVTLTVADDGTEIDVTVAATGGGVGDVVGPAASIDSEVALYSGTTGKLLKRATGTGVTRVASGVQSAAELSGDVTTSGSNAVTIANNAVTYAKMQDVSATARVLGRATAGAGDVEELTGAQLLALQGISITRLASDATPVTGTTGIEVTGLNKTTGTGSFFFQYVIRYQTTAASTGIRFGVNHTGTVTVFMANLRFQALTGAPTAATQATASGTPVAISGVATRTRSTTTPNLGPTISVDTLNADMFATIEGMVTVTVDGDLELWYNAELATLVATVMADSSLILTKLS